ncbi:VCBS repeat-containing protein [uncultured Desulfobacter sp.]|uniref:FG-GAP repeat domain-containing protein n=1 Tax=uncultured Desulfobacter sp. TaxID=240139 RepID=UPI0029F4EA88|nr:VCBS repeat-containing protein [uncultured Desulfobacter sp.]
MGCKMKTTTLWICFFVLLLLLQEAFGKPVIVVGNSNGDIDLYTKNSMDDDYGAISVGANITNLSSLALEDVDKDGYMDIAAVGSETTRLFWGKKSDASSQSYGSYYELAQQGSKTIALKDMYGNGYIDVVVMGGQNCIYKNDVNGHFTPHLISVGDGYSPDSIALGDINMDDKVDILSSAINATIYYEPDDNAYSIFFDQEERLYVQDDNDNFTEKNIFKSHSSGYSSESNPVFHPTFFSPIAFGNMNEDQDQDLDFVIGHTYRDTHIQYYPNNNNFDEFSFENNFSFNYSFSIITSIALGDLDEDGDLDIVAKAWRIYDKDAVGFIFLNDGNGNFSESKLLFENAPLSSSLVVCDIDSDQYLDILTGNADRTCVYLNDGHGNFSDKEDIFGPTNSNVPMSVFYSRKVTINATGLPDHLMNSLKEGTNNFYPPAEFDGNGLPVARDFHSLSPSVPVTAPRVIKDTINNCYYQLTNWFGTKDGEPGTDEEGIHDITDDIQEVSIVDGYKITWQYEKVYRLEIQSEEGADSKECEGSDVLLEECVLETCDPKPKLSGIRYYPENTSLVLTTNKEIGDQACGGLVSTLGNRPTGSPQIIGDRMAVLVFLTKNTVMRWDYSNAEPVEVGAEIQAPDIPAGCGCTIDTSTRPDIKILFKDSADATVDNAFFWSEEQKKLYLVRPLTLFEITWPVNENCTCAQEDKDKDKPFNVQVKYGQWPAQDTIQPHIIGAPANLNAGSKGYEFKQILFSEQTEAQTAVEGGVFNPEKEGKNVLLFSSESDPPVHFLVVEAISMTTKLSETDWDIGKEITNSSHSDPEGKNGFVFYENAFYDGTGSFRAYDRETRTGEIIPVNTTGTNTLKNNQMVVVWYGEDSVVGVGWPVEPVRYRCQWPEPADAIDIGDQNGSGPLNESESSGMIYNQPDVSKPGFNPNEEHALILGNILYALRNDLNGVEDLSEPYVLLKYEQDDKWQMRVFKVELTGGPDTDITFDVKAGDPLPPPTPLDLLPGAFLSHRAGGEDFYFRDHKGGHWAKSAGSDNEDARITMRWFYPLQAGFYYPPDFVNKDGEPVVTGDPVPWLNGGKNHTDPPIDVGYNVSWPDNAPMLYVGETLMEAKYGLPDVSGMAAAQVVFDEQLYKGERPLVKLYAPLAERKVALASLPDSISTETVQGKIIFPELKYSLKSRLSYDPVNQKLIFKGALFDQGLGEPLLLSNVMTESEKKDLQDFAGSDESKWDSAIDEMYELSRNPDKINPDKINAEYSLGPDFLKSATYNHSDWGILLGLELKYDSIGTYLSTFFPTLYPSDVFEKPFLAPCQIVGETMALTAGMAQGAGWVVLAENNHESLGDAPVSLHVMKVGQGPYRGEIKVIKSDNIFDEKLTLRHTGDFAGEPEKVYFQWYYMPDKNGIPPALPARGEELAAAGWILMDQEWGRLDTTIEEAGKLTLSDNWIMCRYYFGHAYPQLRKDGEVTPDKTPNFKDTPNDWSAWAGAPGNQTAQLAEGWIKRVFDDLNPLETRVKDFRNSETNTTVSMISQFGERYEGAIALNSSPENLNAVGLISAYHTVLERGKDFSIDNGDNYGPVNNALLNAATRLAGFYTLLGNEAYADAVDPTIGFDTQAGEFGAMMPSIFAFENQLDSLLEEELILLRGRDDTTSTTRANPVYNRLIWNFTRDIGEVAYTTCYNISDMDNSGIIDEYDAQSLYPQGHGDAWGHYLTAMKYWYALLTHEDFTWEPRVESVLVGGAPVPVDYLDERQFARTAAAKAGIGAEIVNMTYRKHYVDDPAGQWQGYRDTETQRAWGVDGWARRAGQGAYFDWAVANALLPDQDPNPDHQGISKIDRTTVEELKTIVSAYSDIQARMDESDNGLNPVGLAKGVVPFDIDPSLISSGETHFEQIHDRAVKALNNAVAVFEHANNYTKMLRENEESLDDFKNSLEDQERDYLNRLIEIFGYPYEGDIGPSGFYPAGYDGPDWVHFMYMDLPDLTGELKDQKIKEYKASWDFNVWRYDPDLGITGGEVKDVSYQISENGVWFSKPDNWGERRAPGEIQMALSDLIQAQIAFELGLKAYESALGDIEDCKEILEAKHQIVMDNLTVQGITTAGIVGFDYMHLQLFGSLAALDLIMDSIDEGSEIVLEGIPKCVGVATDATAPVRGTIKGVGVAGTTGLKIAKSVMEFADELNSQLKDQLLRAEEIKLSINDERFEVKQLVMELEGASADALVKLNDCLMLKEALQQSLGKYYAVLARGERLLTERAEIRARAAADVQEYRYQDLGFRVFRNDALQKYRASFDLAARYTYLAAAAYDYETNLLGYDYGAGREFLTDIVRQRSLGEVSSGIPISGSPGLADPLARLEQNFDVYKTQLGFNNPQTETNRFSLRTECFRIKDDPLSDSSWRAQLMDCRVDNLWDVPEFKKFCRPFAPEYLGEQPGLVIPFETMVTFGKNYFGYPLSGGDSAYDPTHFATKIRSAGVWFSDYNISGLSNTPRIYLVPVGADILRSPTGDGFSLREWHVVDQKLPVPFPIGASDLTDDAWIPKNDSLSGEMGGIRRFSSFRAYHDSGAFNENETVTDTRLIGRSVWNTSWLMIIPGGTLLWDPDDGLDTFIDNVSDIKLFFQTYSFSGN